MMLSRQVQALSSARTAGHSPALAVNHRVSGLRRATVRVRAQEGPEGAPSLLQPGTKVKVKESIKVYHVPKQPQGVDLQGMQGEIEKNVALYTDKQGKSHVLSPNFPYIVKLQAQIEGKDITIKAHLVSAFGGAALAQGEALFCVGGCVNKWLTWQRGTGACKCARNAVVSWQQLVSGGNV
eukprot:1160021-Pelagomonas_calceolata.AAC.3